MAAFAKNSNLDVITGLPLIIMIALADIAMALKMIYFAIVLLSKQSSGAMCHFSRKIENIFWLTFYFSKWNRPNFLAQMVYLTFLGKVMTSIRSHVLREDQRSKIQINDAYSETRLSSAASLEETAASKESSGRKRPLCYQIQSCENILPECATMKS